MPSESDFLAWVAGRQRRYEDAGRVVRAAGDDLAVLRPPPGMLLAGCDPVLDGVHLHVRDAGFAAVGRKAVNRNLSDVAAMNGRPVALLVSLVLPRETTDAQARDVYLGAEAAADAADCPIVGGDFAVWDGPLAVTVTVLASADAPTPRGPVRPGQTLYVTGSLGGSGLGRHLSFSPRLDVAGHVVRTFTPSAMMDVSDGLSKDLPRLVAGSGRGATVDAELLPVHDDARRLARQTGRDPLFHALTDGEDYELLFAADDAPGRGPQIPIGTIDAEPGLRLRLPGGGVVPLPQGGWEHGAAHAGGGDVSARRASS